MKKNIIILISLATVALGILVGYRIWSPLLFTYSESQLYSVINTRNETERFLGNKTEWQNIKIELRDVQGLYGGRNIFIQGSGKTLIQKVDSDPAKGTGLFEKRYIVELNDYKIRRLINNFIRDDFVSIKINPRSGIPDEAKPEIALYNSRGESRKISKWDMDTVDRFDHLYGQVLEIEQKTENLIPITESKWDSKAVIEF